MADIKTRDKFRGSVKTLNKAAAAGQHMKSAYIKTKDNAKLHCSEKDLPAETAEPAKYAADNAERAMKAVAYRLNKQGRQSVKATQENIAVVKAKVENFKMQRVMKSAERKNAQNISVRMSTQLCNEISERAVSDDFAVQTKAAQLIRNRQQEKRIAKTAANTKRTVKSAAVNVKTGRKNIKTAEVAADTAVKKMVRRRAARAAAVNSAKTSQKAAYRAKLAAKTVNFAAKATAKAIRARS